MADKPWREKWILDLLRKEGNCVIPHIIFKTYSIQEVEDDLAEIIGLEVKIRIARINYFKARKGAFRTRNVKIPCYIAEVYR